MRILYEDGKLLISLTKDEIKEVQDNSGRPIEIDIGNIKVLHDDIGKAISEYIGEYWDIANYFEEKDKDA